MNKTACLIDAGYMKNILCEHGKPAIDYLKFVQKMVNSNDLLRTYYYDCKVYVSPDPTEDEKRRQISQDKFINYLEGIPQFECKYGRIERRKDEFGSYYYEQKRVDVMFAIDLVTLSTKHLIDHAVIVTGDSDMIPAIQIAKNEGVIIELYYSPRSTHKELIQTVDTASIIDSDWIKSVYRDIK